MRTLLDSFIERAKEIRRLRQHLEEAKEIQKCIENTGNQSGIKVLEN